jgi:polyisoprenoid-binding protein YceI
LRAALLLALAAGLPAHAADEFVIDPSHTFATFSVRHLDIATQRGRFDRSAGRVALDAQAGAGSVSIEIDAASVSTGNARLDATLRGEDFFDTERHPQIAFRSTRVELEQGAPARIEGELTLLGVTRPVTLRVERFACTRKPFLVRTTCGADATATLSRSAFGMKSYAAFIGDEVRLDIQAEAVKQEPAVEPAGPPGG